MTINSPDTITAPNLDSKEAHLLTLALNILDWDKSDFAQYLATEFKREDLAALSYAELEDLFFKLHGLVIASVPLGTSHKNYWQAFREIYHPYGDLAINKIGNPGDYIEDPDLDWVEPLEPWQWYQSA